MNMTVHCRVGSWPASPATHPMRAAIVIVAALVSTASFRAQAQPDAGQGGSNIAPGEPVPLLPLDELTLSKPSPAGEELKPLLESTQWKEHNGPVIAKSVREIVSIDLHRCDGSQVWLGVYGLATEHGESGGRKERELLVLWDVKGHPRAMRISLREVAPWASRQPWKSLVFESFDVSYMVGSREPVSFLLVRPADDAALPAWGLTVLSFEPEAPEPVARIVLAYRGEKARPVAGRPQEATGVLKNQCRMPDLFMLTDKAASAYENLQAPQLPRFAWDGRAWVEKGIVALPARRINVRTSNHVIGTGQSPLDLMKLAYPQASFDAGGIALDAPSEVDSVVFVAGVWLDIADGHPKGVKGLLAQVNERVGEPDRKETRVELLVLTAGPAGKQTLRARLVIDDWRTFDERDHDGNETASSDRIPTAVRLAPEGSAACLQHRYAVTWEDGAEWTKTVRLYALDGNALRLIWADQKEKGSADLSNSREVVRKRTWSVRAATEPTNGLYDLEVVTKGGKGHKGQSEILKFDGKTYPLSLFPLNPARSSAGSRPR